MNNLYSNTYNFRWRNHPNFSWNQNQNPNLNQTMRFSLLLDFPCTQENKPNLEDLVSKSITSAKTQFQN